MGLVSLRPVAEADRSTLRALFLRHGAVWRPWLSWAEDGGEAWLDRALAAVDRRVWVIERGGGVVGAVWLNRFDPEVGSANLGVFVDPDAQGAGIATTAVREAARLGLTELGLTRIELRVATANLASHRTARRAGARWEGVLRAALPHPDGPCDVAVYSLLAEDLGPDFGPPLVMPPVAARRTWEAEGLRFAPYAMGDAPALLDALTESRAGLTRWMGVPDGVLGLAEAEAQVRRLVRGWDACQRWAFLVWQGGQIVGEAGLRLIDAPARVVTGWAWVRPSCARRGVGRLAVREVAAFGGSDLGIRRVELHIDPGNLGSQRAAAGAGARFEGVARQRVPPVFSEEDVQVWGLLPADLTR